MDYRRSYQEHYTRVRDDLRAARSARRSMMRLTLGTVDPSRLSDTKIDEFARRDAERVVNTAINQELERQRKKGQ